MEVFVVPDQGLQAGCMRMPTVEDSHPQQDTPCLTVSAGLLRLFEGVELRFVIGHELGHYLFGHHELPQEAEASTPELSLEATRRSHYAELSADRAGLCACQDPDASIKAIIKLACGLPSEFLGPDFTSYVEQLRDLEKSDSVVDSSTTHPLLPLRARNLVLFAQSDVYGDWVEGEGGNLKLSDCDQALVRSYRQVSGAAAEARRVVDMAAFWGSLSLFTVDGRISAEEQEWLVAQFGRERAEGALRFLRGHGHSASDHIDSKLNEMSRETGGLNSGESAELHETLSSAWQVSGGDQATRDAIIGSLIERLFGVR